MLKLFIAKLAFGTLLYLPNLAVKPLGAAVRLGSLMVNFIKTASVTEYHLNLNILL
jgi:hypothetical protein